MLLLYALWLVGYFVAGHDIHDFIVLGLPYVTQSHASSIIRYDPQFRYTLPAGYDGQFCYFIAVDPVHARYYVDSPVYRYMRILYPMLARMLALGQPYFVPYTLVAINVLAIVGGTWILALWLARKGRSPWFALVYGLYPGLVIGLQRDLTEPLSYALVALAVYCFDFAGRRRIIWSGLSFALAILTRETSALFAVLYSAALLLEAHGAQSWYARVTANWRRAALLLGLAVAPMALYAAFLQVWLGSSGPPTKVRPVLIPFQGLLALWPWTPFERMEATIAIVSVVLPAVICGGVALWALVRRARSVAVWALLANIVLFVVMLNTSSYFDVWAVQRVTTGVMLSALLCLPSLDRLTNRNYTWLLGPAALWMLPDLWLLPVMGWITVIAGKML